MKGDGLKVTDYFLLILSCAALYGVAAFSGRPLSLHEARLPQLAREMAEGKSDWLLPQSGGRPWLERPPLPHWFTAGSMLLFGRDDVAWVARVPVAVMGCLIVLMGAWMASRFYGRNFGLLVGVVLATSYELYQYACQAEDDIYLGAVAVACMAMFVKAQTIPSPPDDPDVASSPSPGTPGEGRGGGSEVSNLKSQITNAKDPHPNPPPEYQGRGDEEQGKRGIGRIACFVSGRPWPIWLMFFLLGLTNWAKGPLVGAAPLIGAIGVYLLWNHDWQCAQKYLWLWGWVIFLGLTVAWPLLALYKYPDVWDNWIYDYTGRAGAQRDPQWDHPFWYYVAMLPMALAPWIWATPIGLIATAKRAWTVRNSAERLLWCWAIVGLLVLSLPARKHHHYLVPIITPWAILSALGLIPVGRFFFAGLGPRWTRQPWFGFLILGLPGAIAIIALHRKIPGDFSAVLFLSGVWILCIVIFYMGLLRQSAWLLMGAFLLGFVVLAAWLQFEVVSRDPGTLADLQFLHEVRASSDARPLMINSMIGDLEFFRLQFYLPGDTRLLHNLSFLRDETVKVPVVYVVTRARDQEKLKRLGEVQIIAQSEHSYEEQSPTDRFTLFRLTFSPELKRYPLPSYVGVMQAMERRKGPWCGPEEF